MTAAVLFACTEMDHTYREFWEDGELDYPVPVDSVKVFPGKKRIGFEWIVTAGSGVVLTKMYWNNKSDSAIFPASITGQTDTVRFQLDNMREGTYAFTVYTFNGNGRRSVSREITGKVYGDTYESMLLIRLIKDAYYENGEMIVLWRDPADATSFGSELTYQSVDGEMHTVLAPPQIDTLKFADYDTGSGAFEYRTAYLPAPASLDTFYTPLRTVKVKGPIRELAKTGWTVTASSWDTRYPSTNLAPRTPEMVIDGSFTTRWVNEISPTQTVYPHWIAVDMQSPAEVYGVVVHGGNNNETPSMIVVWVSEDGLEWTSKGTYSVLKNQNQYFEIDEPQTVQHVKIECIVASNGATNPNTNIYELGVYTR
jgi:hypothetical protein